MFRLQPNFVLCLGCSSCLIADSICHGQWHVFGVRHQPPCSGKFAWLGNHASLANRTGATVEVVKARYDHCSCKNHKSVTATTLIKIFLNGDCALQNSEVARL